MPEEFIEPAAAHHYLEPLAEHFGRAMLDDGIEVHDIPAPLVAWALLVAGKAISQPKRILGRPPETIALRNLKIFAAAAHLRRDHSYTRNQAIDLIAEAIGREPETVKTALTNGRKASETRYGIFIFKMLDLMGEKLV